MWSFWPPFLLGALCWLIIVWVMVLPRRGRWFALLLSVCSSSRAFADGENVVQTVTPGSFNAQVYFIMSSWSSSAAFPTNNSPICNGGQAETLFPGSYISEATGSVLGGTSQTLSAQFYVNGYDIPVNPAQFTGYFLNSTGGYFGVEINVLMTYQGTNAFGAQVYRGEFEIGHQLNVPNPSQAYNVVTFASTTVYEVQCESDRDDFLILNSGGGQVADFYPQALAVNAAIGSGIGLNDAGLIAGLGGWSYDADGATNSDNPFGIVHGYYSASNIPITITGGVWADWFPGGGQGATTGPSTAPTTNPTTQPASGNNLITQMANILSGQGTTTQPTLDSELKRQLGWGTSSASGQGTSPYGSAMGIPFYDWSTFVGTLSLPSWPGGSDATDFTRPGAVSGSWATIGNNAQANLEDLLATFAPEWAADGGYINVLPGQEITIAGIFSWFTNGYAWAMYSFAGILTVVRGLTMFWIAWVVSVACFQRVMRALGFGESVPGVLATGEARKPGGELGPPPIDGDSVNNGRLMTVWEN